MKLRAKAFDLSTRMGPAAEAYMAAADPVWNQPKQLMLWRQVSDNKLKKLLTQAWEELRCMSYKEEMYLDLIHKSNQQLALLDLTKEEAQALKEQVQQATHKKDLAVVRARLDKHQADQDATWYEEQLAAADMAQDQLTKEKQHLQQL